MVAAGAAATAAAAKPFPWKRALILAWCQFTSAFSFAVLFPFVSLPLSGSRNLSGQRRTPLTTSTSRLPLAKRLSF